MRFLNGLTVFVCFLLPALAESQDSVRAPLMEPPEEYPVAVSFFAPLFFPKILQDEYRLKEFIQSEEFDTLRLREGDLHAVDAIFKRALRLSWSNVYEALLLSFVCTMEHRNFGVKLPLLGALLWFPLTSEFPDEFHQRVRALPRKLYDDTPRGQAGDRDKLQHFFGSALVTYMMESRDAAERVGMFVEWGEDRFVVGGLLDQRDIRANEQGEDFGACLLRDAGVLPSAFLGKGRPARGGGCIPGDAQRAIDPLAEER